MSDKNYEELLYKELVTVKVGADSDERTYHIHKNVLCQVPFLAKMLTGGFREATSNEVSLPAVEQEAFDQMIGFLYSGKVKRPRFDEDLTRLVKLWVLADQWRLPSGQNETMREMYSGLIEHKLSFTLKAIKYVYQNTVVDSELREYCSVHPALRIAQKKAKVEDWYEAIDRVPSYGADILLWAGEVWSAKSSRYGDADIEVDTLRFTELRRFLVEDEKTAEKP